MRSAPLRPACGKPVDQSAQPFPFRFEVPFILHHKFLGGRRIPAQRFVVTHHLRLHHPPNDPPYKHPRRSLVPQRHLHPSGTMLQCLRCIHLAPQPLIIPPQLRYPPLHFSHSGRFKEIFHTGRSPPVNRSQPSISDRAGVRLPCVPTRSSDFLWSSSVAVLLGGWNA